MAGDKRDRHGKPKREFSPEEVKQFEEAQRIVQEQRADPYAWSHLPQWLELDTWKAKEGLALLADIDPTGADINWDGYYNSAGVVIEEPELRHAQLLSETDYFYIVPMEVKDEDRRSHETETSWAKHVAMVEDKRKKLRLAESRLRRLKRLWDSDQRTEDRYPILEFVWWAESEKIEVPWRSWAEKKGLLKARHVADPDESPSQRRERLAERHRELTAQRVSDPTRRLADAEGISPTRIRQLLRDSKKPAAKPSHALDTWLSKKSGR